MKFGCIADDFTGATDLAGLLRRSGASVKLHFGLPDQPSDGLSDIEIIALKCRTEPVAQAVSDCSEAAIWLLAGALNCCTGNTARPLTQPTKETSGRWLKH